MLGGSLTLLRTFDFGFFLINILNIKRISGFRFYENLGNLISYLYIYIYSHNNLKFFEFWKMFLRNWQFSLTIIGQIFYFFWEEEMFFGTPGRLSISKHLKVSTRLSTFWVAGYASVQVIK
jgi:hypothetical protein